MKALNFQFKIGLFGGTFNPIHIGHIKMAEAARKEYKLSVVYFIPCGVPPHKSKKDLLSAKIRYELVKKAIKGKKYFKVLDIEIKKKKPAYTIDTIKMLMGLTQSSQGGYPSLRIPPSVYLRSGYPPLLTILRKSWLNKKFFPHFFFFLIGQDEFEKLHTWNKASELAKMVTFLVLPRTKKGFKRFKLPKIRNLKWSLVHTKTIDISASEIRKKLKI